MEFSSHSAGAATIPDRLAPLVATEDPQSPRAFALPAGEGTSARNPVGGVLTFKSTAQQTGGQLTAFDAVNPPGEGPPLHVHVGQDEFLYIVEGDFRVRLGDELIDAAPGSFVFIPRGTAHTWQTVGEVWGRFVGALVPASAGFEEFFIRFAELPAAERGPAAFARVAAETRAMDVVGPPLARADPADRPTRPARRTRRR